VKHFQKDLEFLEKSIDKLPDLAIIGSRQRVSEWRWNGHFF